MAPRVIALEGPSGAGKSTHAALLAEALRAEGVEAVAWAPGAPPPGEDIYERALREAGERYQVLYAAPPRAAVLVADGWYHRTLFLAAAYLRGAYRPDRDVTSALRHVARAESYALRADAGLVLLDADDVVLDARRASGTGTVDRELRAVLRAENPLGIGASLAQRARVRRVDTSGEIITSAVALFQVADELLRGRLV